MDDVTTKPEGTATTPPEPKGKTLEEKLSSARGIIADFFKQLSGAFAERDKAVTAQANIQKQFDELTSSSTKVQEENKTLKDQVKTLTTERDDAQRNLSNANANVSRLESLCGVKGVDPKAAIAAPQSEEAPKDRKAEYKDLLQKEDAGQVPSGTAHKFYRKHKKEIGS